MNPSALHVAASLALAWHNDRASERYGFRYVNHTSRALAAGLYSDACDAQDREDRYAREHARAVCEAWLTAMRECGEAWNGGAYISEDRPVTRAQQIEGLSPRGWTSVGTDHD